MRMIGMAALATTAALGCSAASVTAYASHSSSRGGNGGSASSTGGDGGNSTGGNGVGCGHGNGGDSNDLNNIGGGQTQILNGVNLLDNLFVPVLSPGGRVHQRVRTSGSKISHSRGAVDRASTAGGSPRATSDRWVTPTVATPSTAPRWTASPARRGWSTPVASTRRMSGAGSRALTAAASAGPSRSASNPGAYGAGTVVVR